MAVPFGDVTSVPVVRLFHPQQFLITVKRVPQYDVSDGVRLYASVAVAHVDESELGVVHPGAAGVLAEIAVALVAVDVPDQGVAAFAGGVVEGDAVGQGLECGGGV